MKRLNFGKIKLDPLLVVFLAGSIACGWISSNTIDYQLDNFSYMLNDYNLHNYYSDFSPPVMSIKRDDSSAYKNLFDEFYYSDFVQSCRVRIDNVYEVFIDSGEQNSELRFFTQPTFSIKEESHSDGGYLLDYGQNSVVFNPSTLQPIIGNSLSRRYGADAFVFISDTYANKLIDHYGIGSNLEISNEDKYLELMTNEQYCMIKVVFENDLEISLCINNIVISTSIDSPRYLSLYGDFGLVYYSYNFRNHVNTTFEMDLKVNPFGNKSVFSSVKKLGFDEENSTIEFMKYDYSNGKYFGDEINDTLNAKYRDIWISQNDYLWQTLFFVMLIAIVAAFILILLFRRNLYFNSATLFYATCILFILYSIVASFVYVYPFFSICPLLLLIICFIYGRKEINRDCVGIFEKILRKNKNLNCKFHSIEI